MPASDPMMKLFNSMKHHLGSLIEQYEELAEHQRAFPQLFERLDRFAPGRGVPISELVERLKIAMDSLARFQQVNEQYFFEPLQKISELLPSISPLFKEKEELHKEIEKQQKKYQKVERLERTAENVVKVSKYKSGIESMSARLLAIDALLERDLLELTSRTEMFLSRILKAHLNWKYQSYITCSTAFADLASVLYPSAQSADLSTLDKEMTNQLNELRNLSLTRRS